MYPDERVVRLVTSEFLPIRVHVRDPDSLYARVSERLNVHWTPTILILDQDGAERHRIEGFLPLDDFLAHLKLGLAKTAFQRSAFEDAERRFREVVAEHSQSEPAPEALYWAGVSRYKGKNDERPGRDGSGLHDAVCRLRLGQEGFGVASGLTGRVTVDPIAGTRWADWRIEGTSPPSMMAPDRPDHQSASNRH